MPAAVSTSGSLEAPRDLHISPSPSLLSQRSVLQRSNGRDTPPFSRVPTQLNSKESCSEFSQPQLKPFSMTSTWDTFWRRFQELAELLLKENLFKPTRWIKLKLWTDTLTRKHRCHKLKRQRTTGERTRVHPSWAAVEIITNPMPSCHSGQIWLGGILNQDGTAVSSQNKAVAHTVFLVHRVCYAYTTWKPPLPKTIKVKTNKQIRKIRKWRRLSGQKGLGRKR